MTQLTVTDIVAYAHTPMRCLRLTHSPLILLPKVLILSSLSRSLALTLGLVAVRMPSVVIPRPSDLALVHIFILSCSPNACRQIVSNISIMDVIYLVILVLFMECPWVAQVSAHKGPQEIHWPSRLRPQIPRFHDFPFLLNPPFSQSPVLADPSFSLRAMAPRKAKQPLESSSVATAAAVGRPNVKDASRHSSAHPVGLSGARSKVTFLCPL